MCVLLGLEEEDCAVAEVEVYEVLCLVRDEGAEVAAYDAVPCRAFALVELEGFSTCFVVRGQGYRFVQSS
jgi:hypothetical protein